MTLLPSQSHKNNINEITTKKGKLVKDETGHWVLVENETDERSEEQRKIEARTSLAEHVIANVIAQSSILLAQVGIQSSRLDAEILLMHALGWEREKVIKHWTDKLNLEQHGRFLKLLERRLKREPIAYIIGYKHFYEMRFYVDDRVLIPRPETEILVKKAIHIIKQHGTEGDQFALVDVGTGSGNIALSIAKSASFTKIFATDLSPDAIEVAKINASLLSLEQNVAFLRGDLLNNLPHPVDLIIANLPYIPDSLYQHLEPEITQYEPKSALRGGEDGLDLYRRLMLQVPQYLLKGGKMVCEVDPAQINPLKKIILNQIPSAEIEVEPDLQGIDRLVTMHTR